MKHSFGRTIAKALLVSTLFGTASVASVANAAVGTFPSSTFSSLDYGLYWFGDADNYQKAIPNQSNAYYSVSKPTIIYIHGWQKGSSKALNRESFNRKDAGGPDLDLAYAWRQAGYNVGIMYWNQFADEDEVKDAEAKIWTATGTRAMRWRNASGVYVNGPTQSASDLLFQSYKDNLAGYTGSNIRLAGHSLGNQMAIVLAKKISDAVNAGTMNSKLLPKRIALLDPFYSQNGKTFIPPFAYPVNTAFYGGGLTLDPAQNGYASTATNHYFQINNEINATYLAKINDNLSSTTQVGYSVQYEKSSFSLLQGRGLAPFVETVTGASTALPGSDSRGELSVSGTPIKTADFFT